MTQASAWVPPPPSAPLTPIAVTCGLGTWGWRGLRVTEDQWSHPDSSLWRYLNTRRLRARSDRRKRGFSWGTGLAGFQAWRRLIGYKPSLKDWEVGAANFYDYHRPATVDPQHYLRGKHIHAIMHSHAGNLPYIACSELGLKMNVLATVSTPIRMDVLRAHGEKARENIGFHIHYWSEGDEIQAAGELGDGYVGILREHPYADVNIKLPRHAGHTGLLENPFYFEQLRRFIEEVYARHGYDSYLDNRPWSS